MANNSVVTQEKLQEFYDKKVYPYLNGATHTGCVPVGTVISYFGETAPEHFLICDGTEYAKSDYPQLADLLLNLTDPTPFEGSDSDHFKVPDLRGEFLRGTGTNGHANSGNGADVGVHQDGTLLSSFETNQNVGSFVLAADNETYGGLISSPDSIIRDSTRRISFTNGTVANVPAGFKGTSRPTNTSVTYIIAYRNAYIDLALDSFPIDISNPTDGQLLMYDATAGRWVNGGHKYSTDEHVVGTWIDSKPVYEKIIDIPTTTFVGTNYLYDISNLAIDVIVSQYYQILPPNSTAATHNLPFFDSDGYIRVWANKTEIDGKGTYSAFNGRTIRAILQYTKTTDTV